MNFHNSPSATQHLIGQEIDHEEALIQDINPASGMPTVGGAGSPDVAGNSWCTVDNWCPEVYYEAPFDSGGCGFSDF